MDRIAEFLARLRGLPGVIAIALTIINFIVQFIPILEPIARVNLFLHLALVVGLIGMLLIRTL